MTTTEKVLFSGKTHTTASRGQGASGANHERLDLKLTASGGEERQLTAVVPHPTAEQLFAGAWSACYTAAMGVFAQQKKMALPPDLSVDIEVDLLQSGAAWFLRARLNVHVPGVPREVAEALAHGAHEICPYSKATRGNIDVALTVV